MSPMLIHKERILNCLIRENFHCWSFLLTRVSNRCKSKISLKLKNQVYKPAVTGLLTQTQSQTETGHIYIQTRSIHSDISFVTLVRKNRPTILNAWKSQFSAIRSTRPSGTGTSRFCTDNEAKLSKAGKAKIRENLKKSVRLTFDRENLTNNRRQTSSETEIEKDSESEKRRIDKMPSTRTTVISKEKERYLQMTIEERRKLYKCGEAFTTLAEENVPTWETYYRIQRQRLEKLKKKDTGYLKQFPVQAVNKSLNRKISLWAGDITRLEIDGIVNAANNSLLGGGGVDGAIHRAAGSNLKAECATLHGCDTGDAKITCGYKLPAKYVLHTVGPMGEQKKKLQSCYETCLCLMEKNDLHSIAFPCISTGIYGYPPEKAAPVAIASVRKFLETSEISNKVDRVIFCLFLKNDIAIYEKLMQVFFPVDNESEGNSHEDEPKSGKKNTTGEDKSAKKRDIDNTDKGSHAAKVSTASEYTEDATIGDVTAKDSTTDDITADNTSTSTTTSNTTTGDATSGDAAATGDATSGDAAQHVIKADEDLVLPSPPQSDPESDADCDKRENNMDTDNTAIAMEQSGNTDTSSCPEENSTKQGAKIESDITKNSEKSHKSASVKDGKSSVVESKATNVDVHVPIGEEKMVEQDVCQTAGKL